MHCYGPACTITSALALHSGSAGRQLGYICVPSTKSGSTGIELSCTDIHASSKHAACNDVAESIFMDVHSECAACAPHDIG